MDMDERIAEGFRRACAHFGSAAALARALRIKPPSVSGWKGRIPVERCKAIEELAGGAITRHEMRPDVFEAVDTMPSGRVRFAGE